MADMSPASRNPRRRSRRRIEDAWRDTPLVPAATVAGRALAIVIAIMTFLAALDRGLRLRARRTPRTNGAARSGVEMTIQVMPRPGRDIDADAAKAASIAAAFPGVARGARLHAPAIGGICWRPGSARASTSANCRRRA